MHTNACDRVYLCMCMCFCMCVCVCARICGCFVSAYVRVCLSVNMRMSMFVCHVRADVHMRMCVCVRGPAVCLFVRLASRCIERGFLVELALECELGLCIDVFAGVEPGVAWAFVNVGRGVWIGEAALSLALAPARASVEIGVGLAIRHVVDCRLSAMACGRPHRGINSWACKSSALGFADVVAVAAAWHRDVIPLQASDAPRWSEPHVRGFRFVMGQDLKPWCVGVGVFSMPLRGGAFMRERPTRSAR